MTAWAKKFVPQPVKLSLRNIQKEIKYSGRNRFCPVCSRYSSRFECFGVVPRDDARCVWCGALERHRLAWLFFQRETDLFSANQARKVLHVAPEACMEPRFRQIIGGGYLTADLFAKGVDVKTDITDIRFPKDSFDVIYCSHVLEHVSDDRKAIREFYRILKSGGWAVLLVPITVEQTFEDPSIAGPEEKLRCFGQQNHVRCYGIDYFDRLRAAGFTVNRIFPHNFLSEKEIRQMGITKAAGEICYCEKRAS
jgi:SAM-dependent methyltransferase